MELKGLHRAPRVRLTLGIFGFIRTPLFTGKTNESNFMTPLLDVETVSEKLVDAVYSGYGGTIYLPGLMRYITALVRLYPICFMREIKTCLGFANTVSFIRTEGRS
jgi:hypothetical protein